jgi:3-hydroxyisobutyrate dehydrogenase-like beta-hydroxyacid dehydrogenase
VTAGRNGFVGLGQMGNPMAANIAARGFELVAYDKAGTAPRAPAGAQVADSLVEVAVAADSIFLSLPDGTASLVSDVSAPGTH